MATSCHSHCFEQYTRYNYTCPVCSKSLGDMSVYFRMVDSLVLRDLGALPPAYRARSQVRPTCSQAAEVVVRRPAGAGPEWQGP